MTFREPYITPAPQVERFAPDQAHTDLVLFTNPIPFNQTDWPCVKPVKLYVPDVVHTDIRLYPNPIPFNNTVLLIPSVTVKSSPPDVYHLNILLPTPFNQQSWANNSVNPDWAVPVQYPNIALTTVVVQGPIIPFDWGRTSNIPDWLPSGIVQTNINLFTNPIPFNQQSWPSVSPVKSAPPPQYPDIVLNTAVVQFPFFTQDFSRPFVPVPAKYDQQTLNIKLYTNPIPFNQTDWNRATGFRLQQPDQTNLPDLVLQNFSTPFVQTDWSKGRINLILTDLIYPNIILRQPVQPLPFNQYDWNKLWSIKPIASDQNTLPNIALINPSLPSRPLGIFGWVDWGLVKSPVIIVSDQDSLPNLVLYLTPPPVPPEEVLLGGKWRWLEGVQKYNADTCGKLLPSVKEAAAVLSSAGGHARAKSLTQTQRSNIASNAAKIRWK